MAAAAGKAGLVKIGTDTVANINNWSLDSSLDVLDTTEFGDSFKNYIAGLKDWKATVEGYWDCAADTVGQTALQTAFLAGSSVTLKLYVNATNYYSGTAFITGFSPEAAVDDVVNISLEFQGSGVLGYS
jgi:predicted secreted protein